jgi:hypothetical protein
MRPLRPSPPPSQRGAAALIVVVVLFFILAMVTAYAGRNLIFEQRTSVNNQRATQAFEMAEAGLDFAIGLLSGGRVGLQCQPSPGSTQTTFRERHLTVNGLGVFTLTGGQAGLRPTCMMLSAGPSCSCPVAGAPTDLIEPVGLAPAIQLHFQSVAQPGLVHVTSRGCSSIGTQCYQASTKGNADAVAETSVLLALNSALATPPSAALTARGTVNLNGGVVTVSNADAQTGITINAGGEVINDGAARITTVPGSPGSAIRDQDPSLSSPAMTSSEQMFKSVFGMDLTTYRSQPAAVRITCGGECGNAIYNAAYDNPGRVIWVDGPVTIGSNLTLGAPGAPPVMLIVQGNLTVAANLTINGVLYLHDAATTIWATNAGTTVISGAVIAGADLSITGTPIVRFDPVALRTINLTQGSMVRVPGSWRDFAAGS